MQYLYEPQHYADRYDLFTIERCLKEIEILKFVKGQFNQLFSLKVKSSITAVRKLRNLRRAIMIFKFILNNLKYL